MAKVDKETKLAIQIIQKCHGSEFYEPLILTLSQRQIIHLMKEFARELREYNYLLK